MLAPFISKYTFKGKVNEPIVKSHVRNMVNIYQSACSVLLDVYRDYIVVTWPCKLEIVSLSCTVPVYWEPFTNPWLDHVHDTSKISTFVKTQAVSDLYKVGIWGPN